MAFARRGDIGEWGPFHHGLVRSAISASGITAGSSMRIVPVKGSEFKVYAIYN